MSSRHSVTRGLTEYPRKPHSLISLRQENTLIPQTDESTTSKGRAVLTHSDLPNMTTVDSKQKKSPTSFHQTLTQWRLVFYTSIGMVLLPFILYLIFGFVKEQEWNKSVEETKPKTSPTNNDMPSMYVTCETSLHVKQARVSLNGDGRSSQQALPGETIVTGVKGREASGGTPLFLLGPVRCVLKVVADANGGEQTSAGLLMQGSSVCVTVANGPCEYWVQTKKCSETARSITWVLNKIAPYCSRVVPKIGLACSALFMGDWAIIRVGKAKTMEDSREAKSVEDSVESKTVEDSREAKTVEDSREAKSVEDSAESKTVEDSREAKTVEDSKEAAPVMNDPALRDFAFTRFKKK
uniref:Uncharacterized protein n=1 Tax=Timema poppense TaxID=170557 RepID=A0A7R9D1V3_TIMPO|nr:unnamed protein product [Timema poppensis]